MPYISEDAREALSPIVGQMYAEPTINAGEIQYLIASMIDIYLKNCNKPVSYKDLNDVMGALAGAQQEFYRCVMAPYEQKKLEKNGPVYDDSYCD